ncbi:MAG: OFA family MFS transporter [Candidatus Glassbacteria bacterium]
MKMSRWWIVFGALIVQLCLGAIYSWSVFVNPLKEAYGFTTTQTQIIFSVALAVFALVMIFAGRWQDKKGPRKVALTGGLLLSIGYILAAFIGSSFAGLVLTIGLIGGAGLGFGYVCPIAALIKWFPDKRGLITGLAVAGFGAGAWIFAQLAAYLISANGLANAFLSLGLIFLIGVPGGALLLSNPPAGWVPEGMSPAKQPAAILSQNDYTWNEMLAMPQFWIFWLMYALGASAGLMVIGNLKPFGVHSGLSAAAAGSAVGILALFNGAGRISWGSASDFLSRTRAMLLMFFLQGLMMLFLIKMSATTLLLGVASAWVGFNYGGIFALFPSATADYFGTKNMGVNYGLVFTSYGVAGIVGPILGGKVFDLTGDYKIAFISGGIFCFVAAGLSFFLKKPVSARTDSA